jgi:hypothetical protein
VGSASVTLVRIFALTLLGAAVSPLRAQTGTTPIWRATVRPTYDPLPVGGCGAVAIRMVDMATSDVPRDPSGQRIQISDLDISVTGADPMGVAGEFTASSVWVACACQSATVGSTATVTARYPAAALPASRTVTGASFSVSAPFRIGRPMGSAEPNACQTLKQQTAAGGTTPATAGTPVAQGTPYVPAGAVTLALAPLTVVARATFNPPSQGNLALSPGYCRPVNGTFTDPNIRATDFVMVTAANPWGTHDLRWTAAVDSGAVSFFVCNSKPAVQGTLGALQTNGYALSVLVVR